MDRTSRIGVFVCAILLVFLFVYAGLPKPKQLPRPAVSTPVATTLPAAPATTTAAASSTVVPPPSTPAVEQLSFLENDSLKVTLSSVGAAVKEIELKRHKEGENAHVVLNQDSHSGIMQLGGWPGADTLSFQPTPGPNALSYTATLANGLKWQRDYTLGTDNTLSVKDTLSNAGTGDLTLPAYSLSVGRAEPIRVNGQYQPASSMFLGIAWLSTANFHLITISNFNPSYIPFIGIKTGNEKDLFTSQSQDAAPIRWLAAENQFFTVLLTPTDHPIDHAQFQCFNTRDAGGNLTPSNAAPEIEGAAFFPALTVPAGKSVALSYQLYAGPKDFARLNKLGEQQGELMTYGWLEPLIVPMLAVLHFFHSHLGNYGVAIILLTLIVKILTWPLQSFANRSGKRMQALAPKLKELQAKYKEQPEKLNTETFALYKDYGVNPFGGCVPALIQMPVFFSLYRMLINAGELRGQSFLWVRDLTQPDTIAAFNFLGWHLAINPLPLMVTGLTMVMMRLTPQIGDPNQAKIAQFMPLIFLFIFYNFAAALSLYYVINNCVSIIQIYRNLKKPLPELKRKPKK